MGACHGVELLQIVVCPDIARSTARDIADFAIGTEEPQNQNPAKHIADRV
jgi:hypothetical protein